jgi:DNA-binding NtrC family response regulator
MMTQTTILVFDLGACTEAAVALKCAIPAEERERVFLHHQQEADREGRDAAAALRAALEQTPTALLILIVPSQLGLLETLLEATRSLEPRPAVVVVTEPDNPKMLHDILELGANDFLVPPLRNIEIWPRLKRLLEFQQEQGTEAAKLRKALALNQLVGQSPALAAEIQKLPRLAQSDACLLITGETGTGKEVCARSVHYLSPRAKFPFVPLDCGAVPPELLENELFGHVAGAYTTAQTNSRGVVWEANRGTLFLDEIDSLPLMAQVKLLRFLQEKEYRPLGSSRACKADVRVIAACNGSLEQAMEAGKLRRDLFYRLNVLRLHLPPLRERLEDIPLLAAHFLGKYSRSAGQAPCQLGAPALQKMLHYAWPGNVRELENVIERALVLRHNDILQPEEIELPVPAGLENGSGTESFNQQKARVVTEFEKRYVQDLLQQHQGNIGQAAKAAQKNRRVFFELMRKHGIRVVRSDGGASGEANFILTVGEKAHLAPSAENRPGAG